MAPSYRVELWSMDATDFGPDQLIASFENAKNIGWANWLNEVPQAFFTLHTKDPKVALIRSYKGKSHVKIYRDDELVWSGLWLEHDANPVDTILYAYGHLAGLYWTLTDWDTEWADKGIDDIVTDVWTRAKTTLTNTNLKWVTTGTIEAPVTTSGGSTAISIPSYKVFFKRILFVLKELAALGISDTTNTVVFEITPDGTFNFWKNRGADKSSVVYRYGDGKVANYSDISLLANYRNDIQAVGASPNDPTLRWESENLTAEAAYGRRQEPIFFSYVRDETELKRATGIRAAKALRTDQAIGLSFFPNAIVPPGATDADFRLSDRVKVMIDDGLTNINKLMMVTGSQVIFTRGVEYTKLRLQDTL